MSFRWRFIGFFLLLSQTVWGLVAFVNQNQELVILDLEKRRILERIQNPELVRFYTSASKRSYASTFDMETWRQANPYSMGDYIRRVRWGEKDIFLYKNKIQVVEKNVLQDWTNNLAKQADDSYNDILVHNDSIVIFTDSATIHALTCLAMDTVARAKGGVQQIIPYEPYFILRKYWDMLSISSIYYPLLEYFLAHDFEEGIVDYTSNELLYILTDHNLYSINPILRKMKLVLESKKNISFGKVMSLDKKLFVLTSDQSVVCYDIPNQEVSAITYIEVPPQTIGTDAGYIFIGNESEIYCLHPRNLEVSHLIQLHEDIPQTAILRIENY